jgi:serine/threonine-protein kinase RsbW
MDKIASCCVEQSLTLPSKGNSLALFRHFAADFVQRCGFCDDGIFDIKVAIGEACANAHEHGSPRGEKNNITVICRCLKDQMQIQVIDEGVFKKKVNFNSNGHEVSGRGILLMLAVMDKMTIDESENGTTVTLIKKHNIDPKLIKERIKRVC